MTAAVRTRNQRRNHLLATIAADRRQLQETAAALHQPLALIDLGWSMTLLITRHPFALVSACTVLGAILPRRIGRWWALGPLLWQLLVKFSAR
jgi:YqjK-like protein